jgi:tellurite resistance-related uncharacterized protein
MNAASSSETPENFLRELTGQNSQYCHITVITGEVLVIGFTERFKA